MITIEILRVRIGLDSADPSKDAEIDAALAVAYSIIDAYCDRFFREGIYTEEFTHFTGYVISLRAYPIISLDSFNETQIQTFNYHSNKENGLLHFDEFIQAHNLEITYQGGYGTTYPWPAALEQVILAIFDNVYGSMFSSGTITSGVIKTVRAGDLSITYDDASGSFSHNLGDVGGLVPAWGTEILKLYRRQYV